MPPRSSPSRSGPGDPPPATTSAELTQQLADLTAVVRSFVVASAARAAPAEETKDPAASGASEPTRAADPTVQVLTALTNKLTEAKTELNGQVVHDFDFVYTEPSKYTFQLPAEPRFNVEHAALVKNEYRLYKALSTKRVDPRKGARSYYDKWFWDKVSSPFKNAVRYPTYEDYVRGTDLHYKGMQVFFSSSSRSRKSRLHGLCEMLTTPWTASPARPST